MLSLHEFIQSFRMELSIRAMNIYPSHQFRRVYLTSSDMSEKEIEYTGETSKTHQASANYIYHLYLALTHFHRSFLVLFCTIPKSSKSGTSLSAHNYCLQSFPFMIDPSLLYISVINNYFFFIVLRIIVNGKPINNKQSRLLVDFFFFFLNNIYFKSNKIN